MLFQLCERTGTTDFSGAKKEFDSATQRDRQSESIDPNNTCFVAGPVGSFCSYRQGTFVIRDLLGTICTARPVCFLLSAAGLAVASNRLLHIYAIAFTKFLAMAVMNFVLSPFVSTVRYERHFPPMKSNFG
ncbi:hypothetical protein QL093DRAFT_1104482 [Fusarium oxysporum]|nr:hypothetical protein QL093DRAFT_1104482 [Fusarium oxysporum]